LSYRGIAIAVDLIFVSTSLIFGFAILAFSGTVLRFFPQQITSPAKEPSKANSLAWLVASLSKTDQAQAPFSPTAFNKNAGS